MNPYQESFSQLLIEQDEHLLWITLNRPEYSNAFSESMINDLVHILKYADWDKQIRTIILSGAGKCFCAGGDIKAMEDQSGMFAGDSNELRLLYMKGIQQIPLVMQSLQTPIIAMIQGPAIGAGCDLACMCDLRIGSEMASFGETFAKLNLVPGDGGTYFLQRVVGFSKAMELSLTGDIISAQDAYKVGLLNQLTSSEELKEKTKKMAQKIAANAPMAVSMIKKAITHARDNSLSAHLDLLAAYQGIAQRTHDHKEGLLALKEKRLASFKGQ